MADEGIRVPPLTLVTYKSFKSNPHIMYGLFSRSDTASVEYDSEKVILAKDGVLKVDSVEQLHQLRRKLFSRPVLLKFCWKSDHYLSPQADFALLLNTAHAAIRTKLEEPFDLAVSLCARGENFCIEVNVGPSLKLWDSTSPSAGNHTQNVRLFITNCSEYQHCLDCSIIWCCFCAPCWLLTALPYMCVRAATCHDMVQSFNNLALVTRVRSTSGEYTSILPDSNVQHRMTAGAWVQLLDKTVIAQPSRDSRQLTVTQPPPYSLTAGTHSYPHNLPTVLHPPPYQELYPEPC